MSLSLVRRGTDDVARRRAVTVPVYSIPTKPLNVTVVVGDGFAIVSFDQPDNVGGGIHKYIASSSPASQDISVLGSPATLIGLVNGLTYTFTVVAVNPAGVSEPSDPTNPATPHETSASLATTWLTRMMGTITDIASSSTINLTTNYASSYTGVVTGTFILQGRTYATINDSSITITDPHPLEDSDVTSIVSGSVLVTPTPDRWIIQVYRRLAGVDTQVSMQALADGVTGEFTIDLASVPESLSGAWAFGILDAQNGYAPYGGKWPGATFYDGLEVKQYIITDTEYYWNTTHALTNGTFSFPESNSGTKLVRLVETASGDVLAEDVQLTGLIRSFLFEEGDTGFGTGLVVRTFIYDQALALFAAIGIDNAGNAKKLADGLIATQTTSGPHIGGFVFSVPQLSPSFGDPIYRIGAHAIATDALLAYIQKYVNWIEPGSDLFPGTDQYAVEANNYIEAAVRALEFLDTVYANSGDGAGLYGGGFGNYAGDPEVFDPAYVIPWFSIEHNMDIWHAFKRAAVVLGDTLVNYDNKARMLDDVLVEKMYSPIEHRYYQGLADTADPLDANSWGAIQMYNAGREIEANLALLRIDNLFKFTRGNVTGYAPFYDSVGYPGALPTVWFEGSFGVALAQYRVGNITAYTTIIDGLMAGQEIDGSFRYATDAQPSFEIIRSKSVAGTAWSILATVAKDTIWNIVTSAKLGGTIPMTIGVSGTRVINSMHFSASVTIGIHPSGALYNPSKSVSGSIVITTHPTGAISYNLLTAQQASYETVGGWTAYSNVTLSQNSTLYVVGTNSLQLAAVATNYMGAQAKIPVTVGTFYTFVVYSRAVTTVRSILLELRWYNVSGGFLSGLTISGSYTPNTTTGWTKVSVAGTAPVNAVTLGATIFVMGTPVVGEAHVFDQMSVSG